MNIQNTLFVGVDVHKYSHTAVVVNCFNEEKSAFTFSNLQTKEFTTKIKSISNGKNIVFGLEDVNGNGKFLSKELLRQGFTVFNVPSVMTERMRLKTTHRNKSDYLDAKGVAKVTLLSHRTLPQLILSHDIRIANDIQGLVYDREFLVRNQTRIKNQLHVLLHEKFGDNYKKEKPTYSIFSNKSVDIYLGKLNYFLILDKRIKRKFDELKSLHTQIKGIDNDLKELSNKCIVAQKLKELKGCGILSMCKIVAEIKDINRFKSAEKLVRYAGLAPRESSSSNSRKRYTDHAGNRSLNKAVHFIALTQIGNRGSYDGKRYYLKKLQEGKSRLHSLRCLKRQIIVRIFRMITS